MKTEQFRNLINLVEGRDPNLDYDQSNTKVVARLGGQDSREYTLLAKEYQRLNRLESLVKAAKERFKTGVKIHVADKFDPADAVLTRVIETKSFVFEMSKDPKATETVQYKKVIDELTTHLTPELVQVVNALVEQYTSVTQKSPSIKVNPIKEGVSELLGRFKNAILNWAQGYDKKLAHLKALAASA